MVTVTAKSARLGWLYLRVAGPSLATRTRSWIFLLLVGVATIGSLALFATKDVTVKLLPFETSRSCRWSSICLRDPLLKTRTGRCRRSRRASPPCLRSSRSRPMRAPPLRSTSTDSSVTTPCGQRRAWRRAGEPHAEGRARASQPRHRARYRQRLADLPAPEGNVGQGRRTAAGPARALATLLAEIYGPDPETRRATAAKVREAFARRAFCRRCR